MGDKSSIQWTDATWNPVRGCSVVSPGCENCYAMGVAARFSGPGLAYEGLARHSEKRRLPQWTGKVRFVREHLADPIRWRRPRRIFVNSMSDLFHEGVTNEQVAAVFGVMAASPRHTFQILTKRPQRMLDWFDWVGKRVADGVAQYPLDEPSWRRIAFLRFSALQAGVQAPQQEHEAWPLPNVHLGVSVENQDAAEERIPMLLGTPAAVRFISAEPLLGPISLTRLQDYEVGARWNALEMGLHWVIVGGESGNRARDFDPAWARDIVAACKHAGVPVFVKQMGARLIGDHTGFMVDRWRLAGGRTWVPGWIGEQNQERPRDAEAFALFDRAGARMAEWPEDLRVRELPR